LTNTVPLDVDMIVRRALSKDPAERYPNAATLLCAIAGVRDRLMRPARRDLAATISVGNAPRRWCSLLPHSVAGRPSRRAGRGWARLEAVPEIERLNLSGRSMNAVRLAREA
jgi:hypothetical protein